MKFSPEPESLSPMLPPLDLKKPPYKRAGHELNPPCIEELRKQQAPQGELGPVVQPWRDNAAVSPPEALNGYHSREFFQ
jgi:hypothetical protein